MNVADAFRWPVSKATMNLNIGKIFKDLVQAKTSVKDRLDELTNQIASLEHQRNAMTMAPTARADLEATLGRWIEDSAAEFHRTFGERLKPFVRNSRNLGDPKQIERLLTLVGVGSSEEQQSRAVDCALCAAHGPALLQGMAKALDLQEWSTSPVTVADKTRQLDKLSKQISELRTERDGLIHQAEELGLSLR